MCVHQLGGKRKLYQLDGSASDAEDEDSFDEQEDKIGDEIDNKDDTEEKEVHRFTCEIEAKEADALELDELLPPSPANSTPSTSLLVSSDDLAPVLGLSGINLPLQLAAEYSTFTYHGKRRGYTGQLHAIVLTWPNRLGIRETICPGELVWCYPGSSPRFSEGELVKVISAGDPGQELKVELSNGNDATVSMERIHRLSEYLVRRGSVRFSTEQ